MYDVFGKQLTILLTNGVNLSIYLEGEPLSHEEHLLQHLIFVLILVDLLARRWIAQRGDDGHEGLVGRGVSLMASASNRVTIDRLECALQQMLL